MDNVQIKNTGANNVAQDARYLLLTAGCFVVLAICAALLSLLKYNLLAVRIAAAVQFAAGAACLWVGRRVLARGLGRLAAGEPCIDSIIAFGSGAAFLHGCYWLVWQAMGNDAAFAAVYYVPMALVIFIALLGRYLKLSADMDVEVEEHDRLAYVLVPASFSIAILSGWSWYFYSGDNAVSWNIFTACLLMACPVALGITQPAALLRGLKAARRSGEIKCMGALQNADSLTLAVLCDKGTVRSNTIKLTDVVACSGTNEQLILNLAVSLTRWDECKEQPLSQALAQAAVDKGVRGNLDCSDFIYEQGAGVRARCQRVKVGLGSCEYIKKLCRIPQEAMQHSSKFAECGKTVLYLAADGHLCGIFAFAYEPEAASGADIARLQAAGLRTMLLTNSSAGEAAFVASQVHLSEVTAGLAPAEQAEFVSSMQIGGEQTVVIGSCDADVSALQRGAVSVAVRDSSANAASACHIVLKGGMGAVADIITVSKNITKIAQQNIYWALVFNFVGLPLATGIIYALGGPLPSAYYLAVAQLAGCLCVMLNSLRIR